MPTLAKFALFDKKVSYHEMPQSNPLKWQLYCLKDDTLVPQTLPFVCKDFFNDIVGWFYGKTGYIYGFSSKEMEFNDYGVFVRLSNTRPGFLPNVEKLLTPLLPPEMGPLLFVPLEADGEILTLFPRQLFNNTYLISKVTHILRLCNMDVVDSVKEMQTKSAEGFDDQLFSTLSLPEKFQQYWWYAGPDHNSHTDYFTMPVLHNNGYKSWLVATKGEAQ